MTWSDLAELRAQGLRPRLRVIVTTHEPFARRLTWVGAAAIVHAQGEPMPVELLDGLDVILLLGNCERAAAVKRLMDRRGVVPARLQAWCECAQCLTVAVGGCESEDAWLAA